MANYLIYRKQIELFIDNQFFIIYINLIDWVVGEASGFVLKNERWWLVTTNKI